MIFKRILVYPKYPDNLKPLYDLAYNLWATWNYEAIALFYRIDTQLFRTVDHNPLKMLHSLSKEKLNQLSKDKGFLFELQQVSEKFQDYMQYKDSLKDQCRQDCHFEPDDKIAYFSMEFGLHESIHIYAGGLGVLAGDFLKGASDLDLPVVGIGLLYKYGYFTQRIDFAGYQQEIFKDFENYLIPVTELHDKDGNWAHIFVRMLDYDVKVKLWKLDVGKTQLILLDTNLEDNPPQFRDITNELYASDREKRLQQELILGIGGIKALNLLGINTGIYHFNEGHSAFAIIGRLQNLMQEKKHSFSEAKAIIRASTVFTTHTPVIAGNENFKTELVKKYLQPTLKDIGIIFEQFAPMAYVNDNIDTFWLPALAMNFSRFVNGVSLQHARISRQIWAPIFPQKPMIELPITHVTNAVHLSWISPPFIDLFKRYLGPDYIRCGNTQKIWKNIYNIPNEELWSEHRRNKKDMLNFIRRLSAGKSIAGRLDYIKTQKGIFNLDILTIVFARRFAAYKRPLLILKDKQRLKEILTNPGKPVQIIFSGKAHPLDEQCKNMIKEVIDFAKDYNVQDRVIFLENYDINIARHLHWGADLWLNNPAQNMEASGTSGIKAAMNGVLHLSTLEGWWKEGYNGKNGWAITAGNLYEKWDLQEIADANQLYDMLENEITDLYYNRDDSDIPDVWTNMMKDSVYSVCKNFNMNRMLCEYLKKLYIPARDISIYITSDNCKLLKEAISEEKEVLKFWDNVNFVSVNTNIEKREHLIEGEHLEIDCTVKLADAPPELFTVEIFYIYNQQRAYKILPMELSQQKDGTATYKHSLKIEGYGPQNLNIRIKPANKILQDIHPQLVKWKD